MRTAFILNSGTDRPENRSTEGGEATQGGSGGGGLLKKTTLAAVGAHLSSYSVRTKLCTTPFAQNSSLLRSRKPVRHFVSTQLCATSFLHNPSPIPSRATLHYFVPRQPRTTLFPPNSGIGRSPKICCATAGICAPNSALLSSHSTLSYSVRTKLCTTPFAQNSSLLRSRKPVRHFVSTQLCATSFLHNPSPIPSRATLHYFVPRQPRTIS